MAATESGVRGFRTAHRLKKAQHDENLVVTPLGYRRKERIVRVKRGHLVRRKKNGWLVLNEARAVVNDIVPSPGAGVALSSSWVSYAEIANTTNDPFSLVSSTWTVPPLPQANVGQTIYLFNSLQHAVPGGQPDYILQPVLLYGQYPTPNGELSSNGGWEVASFWVPLDPNLPVFVSESPTPVMPGTRLVATIKLLQEGNDTGGWSYEFGFEGYPGSRLEMDDLPPMALCDLTLEMYGVNDSSELPAIASTTFESNLVVMKSGAKSSAFIGGGQCQAQCRPGPGGTSTVDLIYPT